MSRDSINAEPTLAATPTAAPTLAADGHEATIAGEHSAARHPDVPLAPGDRLGRYVIAGRLGAGGMGAVHAAHDPDLDRLVAIKVLHAGGAAHDATGGPQRLLREAQAMARLSHPNVVQVFDVGVVGTRLFLAMEMIDGTDLRQWLAARRRSWRAVVEVFVAAGSGLAAAHDAGLIHRDFKPDNVLCASNGRILVGDFGLAAAAGDAPVGARAPARAWQGGAGSLTIPGAIMGTPAYMAPEQMAASGDITPAVDIFAFSVALHEAVYGRRPFHGDTVANLYVAIESARPDTPPGVKVPRRLAAAIARGLAFDPRQRPPTMHALLAELRPLVVSRRKLWLGAAALVAATAAVTAAVWTASAPAVRCTGGEPAIAEVWDPAREQALAASFAATGLAYAGDTWTLVAGDIDEHLAAWSDARRDACAATHDRGEQSPAVLDQRMACLDHQLADLGRLLEFLGEPDARVVDHAVALVADLHDPAACDAAALLSPTAEPPPTAELAELDARITHAARLVLVGKTDAAIAELGPILADLRARGPSRLLTRALAVRAHVAYFDDRTESPARVAEALAAAMQTGDDLTFASMSAEQIGLSRADAATRELWRDLGEAALVRAGGDDGVRAKLLTNYANALRTDGDLAAAEVVHREVLELRRRTPDDRLGLGDALFNLWADLATLDRGDEAIALAHEAIALWLAELGPHHPRMVTAYNGLAILAKREADYATALAQGTQALELARLLHGDDHQDVAHSLVILGSIEVWRGDFAAARPHYARALEIFAATSSTRPERHILSLLNMASFHADAEEFAAAEALLDRAVALPSKFARDHIFWLGEPVIRAQIALARRDVPAAERELARVRRLLAGSEGSENLNRLNLALGEAELELLRGDHAAGLAVLAPLRDTYRHEFKHPYNRAIADYLSARLLWGAGRRVEARAAAESARTTYASLASGHAPRVAAIGEWLATHPAP